MRPLTYAQFWPVYLRAHSKPANRALHAVGTVVGTGLLLAALPLRRWDWAVAAVAAGYGFAWTGHFLVEGNRPATFGRLVWSFVSDYRMLWLMLTGGLDAELEKAGVSRP
ncbi:MAG: DUF962 domain-containing protein [Elusimicrobia bacterium]|nr:DUF962 domain-containing protein [Elusimicrobiota bacterium]